MRVISWLLEAKALLPALASLFIFSPVLHQLLLALERIQYGCPLLFDLWSLIAAISICTMSPHAIQQVLVIHFGVDLGQMDAVGDLAINRRRALRIPRVAFQNTGSHRPWRRYRLILLTCRQMQQLLSALALLH